MTTVKQKNMHRLGSGFGSVGRAVAPNTRGPRIESSHGLNFIMNILLAVEKSIIKQKERP